MYCMAMAAARYLGLWGQISGFNFVFYSLFPGKIAVVWLDRRRVFGRFGGDNAIDDKGRPWLWWGSCGSSSVWHFPFIAELVKRLKRNSIRFVSVLGQVLVNYLNLAGGGRGLTKLGASVQQAETVIQLAGRSKLNHREELYVEALKCLMKG